jgi:nicotinate-nucleotide--dimethylbenzimidazole phosphoribosyltransferase
MASRSLVTPTSHVRLEKALLDKVHKRKQDGASLGELEPLAVRLGLMQRTLKPSFFDPQLLIFAADHGIAVDGIGGPHELSTHERVRQLIGGGTPLAVFARMQQIELSVVDCGVAQDLPSHDHLLMRKIAHGTRNARLSAAMSVEQAHAAMRAGMEIGDKLRGNAVVLAGLGLASNESAAMLLSRLSDTPVRDLLLQQPQLDAPSSAHVQDVVKKTLQRHRAVSDPIEVLAALGGFEIAVMVGVMLMAASKRHLLLVDGMPACAALMLASRIAQPVTDYCVFCRSHPQRGLDKTLSLFQASALMELGLDHTDGTGATLAWPLVRSAAALLSDETAGSDVASAQEPADFTVVDDDEPEPDIFPGPRLY